MWPKAKDWNEHVAHAEDVARTPGFVRLRDRVLDLAALTSDDVVVDVGAGTGLLALAAAPRVARVWAIDVAPLMCSYLQTKAASGGLQNITTAVASATSLPLVDACADVVVSNYCFHHLRDDDKRRALLEARRVLRPGGRLAFGDMMFRVALASPRDRRIVADKARALLSHGPPGARRLAVHAVRQAARRGEHPADAVWWQQALQTADFTDIHTELSHHEGGIATARTPDPAGDAPPAVSEQRAARTAPVWPPA